MWFFFITTVLLNSVFGNKTLLMFPIGSVVFLILSVFASTSLMIQIF